MSQNHARVLAASTLQAPAESAIETVRPDARITGIASGTQVVVGLVVFALVWLGELSYISLTPPADDLEQLTWVRSLEWGYHKHPPLPTWLLWLPVKLLGPTSATAGLTGAAFTLGALFVFWRLLCELRGGRYAGLALLATLCITYYNGRLDYYNHNVVLLLISTTSAVLCWMAYTQRRLRWWVALGLMIGLGALTKYQIAVTVLSIAAFWTHQRAWRDHVHRLGALLATLIAILVFLPHLHWLQSHDFGPVTYAMNSSLGARLDAGKRVFDSAHWLVDQLLNRALPAWLLLIAAIISVQRPRYPRRSQDALPTITDARRSQAAKALLLAWGVLPLLFMALMGLAAGVDLQLQWGTAFLLFAVPAAMEIAPVGIWRLADRRTVLAAFVAIQALLLVVSHVTSPRGMVALRDHHWRNFDSAALAAQIAGPARLALGEPVRIVVGPGAVAGALALRMPEHPMVLIDGRFDQSPWVTPEAMRRCGALQIGSPTQVAGGQPVGPLFAGIVWRIVARAPGADACPD